MAIKNAMNIGYIYNMNKNGFYSFWANLTFSFVVAISFFSIAYLNYYIDWAKIGLIDYLLLTLFIILLIQVVFVCISVFLNYRSGLYKRCTSLLILVLIQISILYFEYLALERSFKLG